MKQEGNLLQRELMKRRLMYKMETEILEFNHCELPNNQINFIGDDVKELDSKPHLSRCGCSLSIQKFQTKRKKLFDVEIKELLIHREEELK